MRIWSGWSSFLEEMIWMESDILFFCSFKELELSGRGDIGCGPIFLELSSQ